MTRSLYCQTVAGLLTWSTFSDERTVCHLQLLLASPVQSFSGLSPVGFLTIFYCLRFETYLFITYYVSQGYGRGIQPRLHMGIAGLSLSLMLQLTVSQPVWLQTDSLCNIGTDCTENTASNSFSVVPFMYLLLRSCIGCCGNVFTEPLPSNRRLLWFCYSGFQQTCHNILLLIIFQHLQPSVLYKKYLNDNFLWFNNHICTVLPHFLNG
jgi:hypothetical protein